VKNPEIIYEDQEIIVINKPSGWVVNEAETVKTPTLQSWLEKKSYPLAKDKKARSGIAHRLDKNTSGILLVAKNAGSLQILQSQFKKRTIQKIYYALVHGRVDPPKGKIHAPIGRLPWNRERFGVFPGGKEAQTDYELVKFYTNQKDKVTYSFLKLFPKSGRTHQIRVHMKYLGHPVVSDNFYAGRKTSRKDKMWCPRLFLHAGEICFVHPKTQKKVLFKSPLPKDLASALSSLQEQ